MRDGSDPAPTENPAPQISGIEVALELWQGKGLILFTVLALLFATSTTERLLYRPLYRSSAVLQKNSITPPERQDALARGTGENRHALFEAFNAFLGSLTLAEKIERDYHVLPRVFPARWDSDKRRWRAPAPGILRLAAPILQLTPPHPPDGQDLRDYIRRHIEITDGGPDRLLFEIAYRDSDAKFSHDFLCMVIREIDALLRQRKNDELHRRIARIEALLADTTLRRVRDGLVDRTVGDEIQQLTLNASDAYAIGIIDHVHTDLHPLPPPWVFLWSAASALGLLLGSLLVFVRDGLRKSRRSGRRPIPAYARREILP